jgi:hypothetical protein
LGAEEDGILYLIFFSLVVKEVYKEVLYVNKVSGEMLSAAMCGFVLLCLITTFLFYMIEIRQPLSFSNAGEGKETSTRIPGKVKQPKIGRYPTGNRGRCSFYPGIC